MIQSKKLGFLCFLMVGCMAFSASISNASMVRLKTIGKVKGVRENQLVGYGLVVGLQRTGDTQRVQSTLQSISNMLTQFGIKVDATQLRTMNVAAVMVTAQLPGLLKSGDKIDVNVSSLGDARSLQGGTLIQTPLQGADGQIYAVAQGPLAVGGYSVEESTDLPLIQVNQTTVGTVPNGAIVEKEVASTFVTDNRIAILLMKPDFGQASLTAQALNHQFGETVAKAVDGSQVDVDIPYAYRDNVVDFVAAVEDAQVQTEAPASRVVVNERTGTVVLGSDVRIDSVAVAHGNLRLVVKKTTQVTRAASFGWNDLTHTTTIQAMDEDKKGNLVVLPEGASLLDVVEAVNAVGGTPRDLISILQAIKASGALHAQLEII
jgi:flagellar P-ring protein precursor FlgI